MKTLSNIQATVTGGKLTLTADVTDKNYNMILVRRVTCGHMSAKNLRHIRHVQISDQGIFVKWCNQGFCLELDDIVAIASQVNPATSFAPVVANIKGQVAVTVSSELPATLKWEFTTAKMPNKKTAWTGIANADSTSLQVTPSLAGNWVHCIATNAVGSTIGLPILVPAPKK